MSSLETDKNADILLFFPQLLNGIDEEVAKRVENEPGWGRYRVKIDEGEFSKQYEVPALIIRGEDYYGNKEEIIQRYFEKGFPVAVFRNGRRERCEVHVNPQVDIESMEQFTTFAGDLSKKRGEMTHLENRIISREIPEEHHYNRHYVERNIADRITSIEGTSRFEVKGIFNEVDTKTTVYFVPTGMDF